MISTQRAYATSPDAADAATAWLTVDLAALAANYRFLRDKAGVRTAGMVKADGYGLGMTEVSAALYAAGCRDFFVATPGEAIALREFLRSRGGDDAMIAALCGVPMGAPADYIAHDITPVLNGPYDLALWRDSAAKLGKQLPAILHLDTGMNRLGFSHEEARNADLQGIDLKLVMSHFACADEQGHVLNIAQHKKFEDMSALFPGVPKSLANSSGIFRDATFHYDMVRPGMALYGLNPVPETRNPMKPVVTLQARILQTRHVNKGDTAGYGAKYTFDHDTTLATLALGYADGFHRALGNKASLYHEGRACPIRGRVSMDLTIIETGHLKARPPQPGDVAEIIGPHQDADALARAAGTIGYEILTSLGPRYKRAYKS